MILPPADLLRFDPSGYVVFKENLEVGLLVVSILVYLFNKQVTNKFTNTQTQTRPSGLGLGFRMLFWVMSGQGGAFPSQSKSVQALFSKWNSAEGKIVARIWRNIT